jgi:ligand-binding sensor domain-containing protein
MLMPPHPVLRHLALLATLAAPGLAAQSAPAIEAYGNYTVRSRTVRDGLPSNAINDVLLASDGYLWLATIEGVVRFDGQRFAVFNATNTPALSSNRVGQIAEGPAGRMAWHSITMDASPGLRSRVTARASSALHTSRTPPPG